MKFTPNSPASALKGSETLVMIHGYDTVISVSCLSCEESVSRKRTESKEALLGRICQGRGDHLLLLPAEKSAVSAMGIQSQHRDFRPRHCEILAQHPVERAYRFKNALPGDSRRHISDGEMGSDECNP